MIKDQLINRISDENNFTMPQLFFANWLLKKLNEDYSNYHYIVEQEPQKLIYKELNEELSIDDIAYTFDKLTSDLFLIDEHYEGKRYKINQKGKEILQKHNDLILYLGSELIDRYESAKESIKERSLKEQIDNLTIRQLKGTIFQVNRWWLFLLINAGLTIIVSIIVALIIKKIGLS